MPELPDITIYLECLSRRILSKPLLRGRIRGPALLRTTVPPLSSLDGQQVLGLRRVGKRIVLEFAQEHYLVLHLMIAGRLQWKERDAAIPGKVGLAAFDFTDGTLLLTEASSQKRATLYLVQGKAALAALDPGGLEVLQATRDEFSSAITRENRTLKRALTDPHILSGIGNAYSDEILHHARLSPVTLTSRLTTEQVSQLYESTREVLEAFTARMRAEVKDGFPKKVTAFRSDMAVHGRYGLPCPRCGAKVQRIVFGKHETNYCPACQTGNKLLADRALSRLLRSDWPKTPTELEEHLRERREPARG